MFLRMSMARRRNAQVTGDNAFGSIILFHSHTNTTDRAFIAPESDHALPAQSSQIDAFVSQAVRRYVRQSETGDHEAFERPCDAVLLFADISGFSTLARRFAPRGAEGAEELTSLLNRYFEQLLRIVHDHGLDVVSFAGDAILTILRGDEPSVIAARAATCALEITDRLCSYRVAQDIHLSIRVSVGVGPLAAFAVGGTDNMHLMLVGPTLAQVRKADSQAKPGEVLLSAEAVRLLGEHAQGAYRRHDAYRLTGLATRPEPQSVLQQPLADGELKQLRRFVPPPVLSHIDIGQTDWLAELRRVTVAFVRFDDVDSDSLECGDELKAAASSMAQVTQRYDGTVIHLLADDKGTVAVVCFGIPPNNPEDQAVRAVRFAHAMLDIYRSQGKICSVGISTGNVFCGPLGGVSRRCYTVLGDVVNLAARLMQSSKMEVLCDQATYDDCRHVTTFSRAPNHRIKGYEDPVPVFRANQPHRSETELIGRDHEVAIIDAMLNATANRDHGTLVMRGEPGVGKSKLVEHLVHEAESRRLVAVVGDASNVDRFTPFFVFRAIISSLLNYDPDQAFTSRRGDALLEALSAFPSEVQRLVPLLNSVLGTQFPEDDFIRQLTGDRRTDNLGLLLTHICQAAVEEGRLQVLVIDDAQWLDQASSHLLQQLYERRIGLTIVLATRPEGEDEVENFVSSIGTEAVQVLDIKTIDRSDVRRLVDQLIGRFEFHPTLVGHVWARSGGNPLFAYELISFLIHNDRLIVENGVCQLDTPEDGDEDASIPNSIRDVLAGRINQLSQPVQITAKTASVIGRRFTFRVLDAVFPAKNLQEKLPEYTRELCTQELVAPIGLGSVKDSTQDDTGVAAMREKEPAQSSYIFKNLTTQQVAYQQLPVAQRRKLHESIAGWYSRDSRFDERYCSKIAQHLEKAGKLAESAEMFARAGEYALREGATIDAVQQLSRALMYHLIAPSPSEANRQADSKLRSAVEEKRASNLWQGHYRRLLGEALMLSGDISSSRIELESSLRLLGHPAPRSSLGCLVTMIGLLINQKWRRLKTRHPTSNKLSDQPQKGDVAQTVALANQRLAQIHYFTNDLVVGTSRALRALTVAEDLDDSPGLARSYADLCMVMSLIRRIPMADQYADLAEQVARSVGHLPSLAYVLNVTNMHRLAHGRWEEAERLAIESVEVGKQLQSNRDRAESLTVLAMKRCFTGELALSLQDFDEVLRVAKQGHNELHCAWAHCGRGEVFLRIGRFAEAELALRKAQDYLLGSVSHTEEIRACGLLALCLWRTNRKEEGLKLASKIHQLLSKKGTVTSSALEGIRSAAEVSFDSLRNPNELADHSRNAREIVKHMRNYARIFPIGSATHLLYRGTLFMLRNQPSRAHQAWNDAIESSRRFHLPADEALVLLERAKFQTGSERRESAEAALAIFEQTELLPRQAQARNMI